MHPGLVEDVEQMGADRRDGDAETGGGGIAPVALHDLEGKLRLGGRQPELVPQAHLPAALLPFLINDQNDGYRICAAEHGKVRFDRFRSERTYDQPQGRATVPASHFDEMLRAQESGREGRAGGQGVAESQVRSLLVYEEPAFLDTKCLLPGKMLLSQA